MRRVHTDAVLARLSAQVRDRSDAYTMFDDLPAPATRSGSALLHAQD